MAKTSKTKSTSKRVKVKDLPSKAKKMSKDALKKVRGGFDFNADGDVDGADFLALTSKTALKQRGKL